MNALEVAGMKKNYAGFSLNVSFALEEGKITGFIGRNGAGKTTTIKSLLGFVHPDAGDIRFFSMPFAENEMKIKSRLGVALGSVAVFVFIGVEIVLCHALPLFKNKLDTPDPQFLAAKLVTLALGVVIWLALTFAAYKRSAALFEKQDI